MSSYFFHQILSQMGGQDECSSLFQNFFVFTLPLENANLD